MAEPDAPGASHAADPAWQREADLLADGREFVEAWCRSTRFDHLYPEGANLAILFESYQTFDRLRTVGRTPQSRRRQWRAFKKILRATARRDVLTRNQRIQWRYPKAELVTLTPAAIFERALARIDADVRPLIAARLYGGQAPSPDPSMTMVTDAARHERAEQQFREALAYEALARPDELLRLPPGVWPLLATPAPSRRSHPIATLIFIKFPLRLAAVVLALLLGSYVGAWVFFNDAVLGRFVSTNVSGLIQGELQLGSIHWKLRLIVDLLTGTPSEVVVEDVSVWEPYASYGGQRKRKTAHAERLHTTLVLHEIIPWNRMGIPRFLDIPWVLHFPTVYATDPTWFNVREYQDTNDDGDIVTLLSLTDAFRPVDPDPDTKGLSFAVDAATLSTTTLEIEVGDQEGWGFGTQMSWANFALHFEAPEPHTPVPVLQFSYEVEAFAPAGGLRIGTLRVPVEDLAVASMATGKAGVPLGELGFSATATAADSPMTLEGGLTNLFVGDGSTPPLGVSLWAQAEDAEGIIEHIADELSLPSYTVSGPSARASARISGTVLQPRYRIRADGLTVDALGESAWAADDVSVDATMTQRPLPKRWKDRIPAGQTRNTVHFSELSGAALDGTFTLVDPERPAVAVFPGQDDEPWLLAAELQLSTIDPSHLFVSDEAMAERMAGALDGALRIDELVLPPAADGQAPAPTIDATLHELTFVRERGPNDDGLPQRFSADGRVVFDPQTGVDLEGIQVRTDGTRLSLDGGLDAPLQRLDADTTIALRIDDGLAFARAFGLSPYFAGLQLALSPRGPLAGPTSPPGRLLVQNLGLGGPVGSAGDTNAELWLDHGVLRIRSTDTRLFGGRGAIELWVYLFENGALARRPKIKGTARLTGIDPDSPSDGFASGELDIDMTLDDGQGRPARLDALVIAGTVAAPSLRVAGTQYRDATLTFLLTRETLQIEELVLPLHRRVSPLYGPDVTVRVGELAATGSIGLDADPRLDLVVGARGIPLEVVTRLLGVQTKLGGRIDGGTELLVAGTLSRPLVDGSVNLVGLAAGGVVLGGGTLHVTSEDAPADGGLAAHRELRVDGELSANDTGLGALSWTVDAVAAFGKAARGAVVPIDAEIDASLDKISLAALTHTPLSPDPDPPLTGGIEGVSAHVTTCSGGDAMLSACQAHGSHGALQIDLEVERAWAASTPGGAADADCGAATTLCSDTRLAATLDWPVATLDRPWRFSTGGTAPAQLSLSGSVDLTQGPPDERPRPAAEGCVVPPIAVATATGPVEGAGPQAQLSGTLDLATVAPLLVRYGVADAQGRIDLDLALAGSLGAPVVEGRATLPSSATGTNPILVALAGSRTQIKLSDLELRLQPGWLTAAGAIEVEGEHLRFGSVRGEHTGVALVSPCTGAWGVAAEGVVSHRLLESVLGRGTAPRGALTLQRLVATGPSMDDDGPLDRLEGTVRLQRQSLSLELTDAVPTVEVTEGVVEFSRCRGAACGPTVAPGSIAVWVGGKQAARPRPRVEGGLERPPADAVTARVGQRGRAAVWGVTHVPLDGSRAEGTALRLQLTDVSYRDYDPRGRPVYELDVSSDDLLIQGGEPLVVSGNLTADRARYVKDAVQGVEILALTDEIDVPEPPPPQILRGLQFDLRAQTDSPVRIENNIAHRVEADVSLKIGGTYEAPELSGRFDVEPGGTVDIPFLAGTYEIQSGRVTLERDIKNAGVDVVAVRNEPVYIENEARQILLRLGGTVSAITWDCEALGDVSGAVESTRGCVDYLVLGAGDVQSNQSGVQALGTGGLANARKSLQVVGHVTEFDFGERIEKAVPRYESFVPDVRLRLGQIGPELEVATPPAWFDFDWAHARLGFDYTRGYPGFLLRQSRSWSAQIEILDPVTLELSRDIRSYLNKRIIFDPLIQDTVEMRLDFSFPSLR